MVTQTPHFSFSSKKNDRVSVRVLIACAVLSGTVMHSWGKAEKKFKKRKLAILSVASSSLTPLHNLLFSLHHLR